ncbi:MAG: polyprenol monophosphomannose synthase [Anaerolineae bacterium]|nr:polyprenol monophosphomannose synthase [Anaerolineae bacterium]MDW8069587.1 polyprenol monophosphomannose synthase [Anaerolineae bacterium]
MNTIVVLPTYNEAENIGPMVAALLGLGIPDLRILVVDDASPDGTGAVADRLAAEYPGRVDVLHRTGPRGLGRAYIAGFQRALREGAEVIVQMDCDFSHNPADVPRLLAPIPEYDLVIGSRYVPGGGVAADWGWERRLLSRWGNFYARTILGSRIHDLTGGFRAWRRETVEGLRLNRVRSQGYIFQVETAYLCERMGYRILEVPIHFEERRKGRSKMSLRVQIEAALRVWQVRWRYRYENRGHG